MTTAGAVTEFPTTGAQPEDLAVGADGNIWFTHTGGVGRVTPLGDVSVGLLATDAPGDVASGPDGNLWITDPKSPGAIGRVSLLGALTPFTAGLTPDSQPSGIVAGPGGDLWFAEPHSPAAIGQIDTQGRITEYALSGGLKPDRIAAGVDGALWFISPGAIGRLAFVAGGQDPEAGDVGASSEVPVPRVGRAVVVHPVKGTVRIRRPSGHGFEELEAGKSIPVGSLVDTRHGTVRLSSALDSAGHTQSGVFSGGLFSVTQTSGGMTDLYLRGGSFAACGASRSLKAVAGTTRRKRRTVRSLWGRDRSGRFRTHGRDSVATVRGTTWLTRDRCDGTLTVVKAGAVDVRERRTHRNFVVRAGGRHLVRHRG